MDFWQFYYYWCIYFVFAFFLLLGFSFSFFFVLFYFSVAMAYYVDFSRFEFTWFWHCVERARAYNTITGRIFRYKSFLFFFPFFVYFFILIAHTLIFLCRTLNYKFTGIHFWWKIAEFECCKHFTWSYFILIWRKETLKRYTHSTFAKANTHSQEEENEYEQQPGKKCIWKQIFALHAHSLTNTHASLRVHTNTYTQTDGTLCASRNCLYTFHGQISCYLVTRARGIKEAHSRRKNLIFLIYIFHLGLLLSFGSSSNLFSLHS